MDRRVDRQISDRSFDLVLRCVLAQLDMARHHARLLGLAVLVANIYLARFVAAHQHRGETDLGVVQRVDLSTYSRHDLVAQQVSVHEYGPTGRALEILEIIARSHARRLARPLLLAHRGGRSVYCCPDSSPAPSKRQTVTAQRAPQRVACRFEGV